MKNKNGNNNQNNFNGTTNFNGDTQVAGGDITNNNYVTEKETEKETEKATYSTEPKWRSPFTLGILTWISVILGVLSLIPFTGIIKALLNMFKGNFDPGQNNFISINSIVFAVLLIITMSFFALRRITKKQIRKPIFLNYAISGYGERITIEKVNANKCPICGGKMRYYNKPTEWIDRTYSDGKTKREVTQRKPVLECKRNHEHFYYVDPAETKIDG